MSGRLRSAIYGNIITTNQAFNLCIGIQAASADCTDTDVTFAGAAQRSGYSIKVLG